MLGPTVSLEGVPETRVFFVITFYDSRAGVQIVVLPPSMTPSNGARTKKLTLRRTLGPSRNVKGSRKLQGREGTVGG